MTAARLDRVRALVDILYLFLPMSYSPVTFESIFKESNVDHYLRSKDSNKKRRLIEGFTKLLRYHKNLPFTIIRKVVSSSVAYRLSKRNPLKREEISSLVDVLKELEIDMEKDLLAIPLNDNLPEITVPPAELVKRLENHPLVDEISSEPLELFRNGHYNESVRKVCERFEVSVQQLSGQTDSGKSLMSRVFNLNAPIVKLNPLSTDNEKGIQEGYMYMTMGTMRAIRNIFSHGDEHQRSPEECYEMLLFLNWLFKFLPS